MSKSVAIGAASIIVAALSGSAMAQDRAVRIAHDALATGDYARAEQVLTAEQRVFPGRPQVLVNLAALYARTGRAQQAAALYRTVLGREDVLLDLSAERSSSSHAIAETGLRRLTRQQTATR